MTSPVPGRVLAGGGREKCGRSEGLLRLAREIFAMICGVGNRFFVWNNSGKFRDYCADVGFWGAGGEIKFGAEMRGPGQAEVVPRLSQSVAPKLVAAAFCGPRAQARAAGEATGAEFRCPG